MQKNIGFFTCAVAGLILVAGSAFVTRTYVLYEERKHDEMIEQKLSGDSPIGVVKPAKSTIAKLNGGDNVTIVFAGDSVTLGTGSSSLDKSYVAIFARKIAEKYPRAEVVRYDGIYDQENQPITKYVPVMIQKGNSGQIISIVKSGVGSDSTQRLLNRKADFTSAIPGEKIDLTFLMAGINDALFSDRKKWVSVYDYQRNLQALVKAIQSNSRTEVVLLTPTYNSSGKSHGSVLDGYAERMKQVAEINNLGLIDTHAIWMKHLVVGAGNYGQGDWLTGKVGDSAHPSDKGHWETGNYIFNSIFSE